MDWIKNSKTIIVELDYWEGLSPFIICFFCLQVYSVLHFQYFWHVLPLNANLKNSQTVDTNMLKASGFFIFLYII